jgi:hypothetical protein
MILGRFPSLTKLLETTAELQKWISSHEHLIKQKPKGREAEINELFM